MQSVRALRFVLLLGAVACSDATGAGGQRPALITALPRQLSTAELAIAQTTPDFAVAFLKAVNTTFADSNVFISPLSASMALAMALNGASGETYTEMRTALGLPDRPLVELNEGYRGLIILLRGLDKTVDFRIANSVWYEQSFGPSVEPTFLSDTKTYFDATSASLDFSSPQAVTAINSWVNTGTNGKINKIIERISPQEVMFLINAIYFKGAWRDGFDAKRTAAGVFTPHAGPPISARFMTRKGGFRAGMAGSTQVIELPYGGDAYVMTVALPPEGTPINAFVAGLTPALWRTITSAASAASTFDLFLPRFTLSWEDKLNDELQTLGIRKAFAPGVADFSRLSRSNGRRMYVTDVRQKTFVDVNEEGTEAAAVTSVGIGVTSLPPSFRVDRPFVFAIRERLTGAVVFLGKIVRPTSS